jgi:hypothetical protein
MERKLEREENGTKEMEEEKASRKSIKKKRHRISALR